MVYALPIWTLLIWATRMRLIAANHFSATDIILPLVFTVLAVAALVERRRWMGVLAVTTVAVWAVRLPLVLVHHHPVPFKLVHTVLAVVSVYLAFACWRAVRARHRTLAIRR